MRNAQQSSNQTQQTPNSQSTHVPPQLTQKRKSPLLFVALIVLLVGLTVAFVYKYYELKQKLDNQQPAPSGKVSTADSQPDSQEKLRNLTELIVLPEKKLSIEGKDLRLKFFQTNTSVFSLLVDYTPRPHTPTETDVTKVTSIPQRNIISSWEVDFSSNSRPDLALVSLSDIFLSSDSRFLIFETVTDGISIYDYQQNKIIRSLVKILPEIEGSNLVKIQENKIILGLFEGWGGICDDNAYKVDLANLAVTQLQSKETMKKCTP